MTEHHSSESLQDAIRVIAIDGPSGAGKGTAAMLLAAELQFHLLDSGAIYRAAALKTVQDGIDATDEQCVVAAIGAMSARIEPRLGEGVQVFLNNKNVTADLRNEKVASVASVIAVMPGVRRALLATQRSFRRSPGLVADGRDMGTVVFPDAWLKVYLTASAEERAGRRYKQLISKGLNVTMESLLQETQSRDLRDASRSISPMMPANDALIIDSTGITITGVMQLLHDAIAVKQSS